MSGKFPRTVIEVRISGDSASLFQITHDSESFTYQRPLGKGTLSEIRERAHELLEKNGHIQGLGIREVYISTGHESINRSRSPEIVG